MPIETNRLLIRPVQPGDGPLINSLVIESFKELNLWMPWARNKPSVDDSEEYARISAANWILRNELNMLIFTRHQPSLIGATGFHTIDWRIPKFEIGYWLASKYTGYGFATEAVAGLTQYAFHVLNAKRVEIRMDEQNLRSKKVPERLGYLLESRMRNHSPSIHNNPELRNTLVFVRFNLDGFT